jgi:ParB family chromosome partitioning protein
MVLLSDIDPDPDQPRSSMGDLSDLIASVEEKGVLEPILVRPNPDADTATEGRAYRIISGERRYKAAMEAGLAEVPVIVMEVDEKQALEIALVENLQRKDLTPFEEGEGYHRLADEHDYTHEEISEAVGKSRTVVTESLALLQMPTPVREKAVELGVSSKSMLLSILKSAENQDSMIALLEQVASQGLSRDDLRRAARASSKKAAGHGARKRPYTFKFRAPDKTFNISLSFRRSTVDRGDLIEALEQILKQVKEDTTLG